MSHGPEYAQVERPLLEQLEGMGWNVVTGSVEVARGSGRGSFREVLRRDELRAAIRRINLRDGEPWLDEGRI
ncbi:MAG: hypothetical protein D6692_12375, partial [Planctomycetota bacterium]